MTTSNVTRLNHHEPLDHEEVLAELPSYLLDDIAPPLAARVARHLDDCPSCAAEAARLNNVLGALGTLAPPVQPPPGLRLRLLDQLDEVAPLSIPGTDRLGEGQRPSRLGRLRVRRPARLAWAAAVAAVLVILLAAGMVAQDLRHSPTSLEQEQARQALIQSVIAAPAGRIPLIEDGAEYSYGMLYLAPQGNEAVMTVSWLPPTPSGRLYQVWLVNNGQRANGGVFRVDAGGSAQLLIQAPQPLSSYQSLGITIEPAPNGSPGPTGERVFSCKLHQS